MNLDQIQEELTPGVNMILSCCVSVIPGLMSELDIANIFNFCVYVESEFCLARILVDGL
jgi:hypothetical protein